MEEQMVNLADNREDLFRSEDKENLLSMFTERYGFKHLMMQFICRN